MSQEPNKSACHPRLEPECKTAMLGSMYRGYNDFTTDGVLIAVIGCHADSSAWEYLLANLGMRENVGAIRLSRSKFAH